MEGLCWSWLRDPEDERGSGKNDDCHSMGFKQKTQPMYECGGFQRDWPILAGGRGHHHPPLRVLVVRRLEARRASDRVNVYKLNPHLEQSLTLRSLRSNRLPAIWQGTQHAQAAPWLCLCSLDPSSPPPCVFEPGERHVGLSLIHI